MQNSFCPWFFQKGRLRFRVCWNLRTTRRWMDTKRLRRGEGNWRKNIRRTMRRYFESPIRPWECLAIQTTCELKTSTRLLHSHHRANVARESKRKPGQRFIPTTWLLQARHRSYFRKCTCLQRQRYNILQVCWYLADICITIAW